MTEATRQATTLDESQLDSIVGAGDPNAVDQSGAQSGDPTTDGTTEKSCASGQHLKEATITHRK